MQSEGIDADQIAEWIAYVSEPENFKIAFPNSIYKVNRGEFKVGDIKSASLEQLQPASLYG
jgi:hypothetical protein